MDKNIKMTMLLDIYGKLLTEKQQDMLDLYYNQNLSLSEIAEEEEITRQGVRKIIVDGEKKLLHYEELLGILSKKIKDTRIIENLIEETKDSSFKEKLKELL